MKTKVLISFTVTAKLICVFVLAYSKNRFSHKEAQIVLFQLTATLCIVLLFATLIASHRREHRWSQRSSHGSGHGSRRCGYLDRVECDEPGNLTDGTVSYNEKGFEDTVTYSCRSGFELVGLSARTCLSNGSWSGTMPTCIFTGKSVKLIITCYFNPLFFQEISS